MKSPPPPPREARESQGRPEDEAPGDVRPVPRFRRDVACLFELTESREPPKLVGGPVEKMSFFQIVHMTKVSTQIHSSISQYDVYKFS